MAEREIGIAGLIGSLRRVSLNRWLYGAAVELAPPGMRLFEASIGDLPHYNDDIDVDGGPPAANVFRQQIANADGLLFVTPGIQLLDPRRAEERDRLGLSPNRPQCDLRQASSGDGGGGRPLR